MVFSDNQNVHVSAMIIDATTIAANEAASIDASQGGFDAVRIEANIRGYTGATTVSAGTLQIINSDGSVVTFCDIFPDIF